MYRYIYLRHTHRTGTLSVVLVVSCACGSLVCIHAARQHRILLSVLFRVAIYKKNAGTATPSLSQTPKYQDISLWLETIKVS